VLLLQRARDQSALGQKLPRPLGMRAQAAVPQRRLARLRRAAPAREYVEEARGAQLFDQVADLALRGEGGGDE